MIINRKYNADYVSSWEIYGESTDVKPTVANGMEEGIPDMSVFVEFDTGEAYYYNKETDEWNVIGG